MNERGTRVRKFEVDTITDGLQAANVVDVAAHSSSDELESKTHRTSAFWMR